MNHSDDQDAITVENLECRYGGNLVLRNVNFSVKHREIFYVAGRSGCGKSTLLRHMVGLLEPAQGHVAYFGRDFTGVSPVERRDLAKSFGVLLQNNALWTDMNLLENVSLPLVLHTHLSKETRAEIVSLKLAQVGLAGCEERRPNELSGGMQKRAALARALALDPAILFFDEPTAGLDPINSRQIDHLILQIREMVGATVLVVSHSIPAILGIADRMILLDPDARGIIAQGSPAELAETDDPPQVRQFFQAGSVETSANWSQSP